MNPQTTLERPPVDQAAVNATFEQMTANLSEQQSRVASYAITVLRAEGTMGVASFNFSGMAPQVAEERVIARGTGNFNVAAARQASGIAEYEYRQITGTTDTKDKDSFDLAA